MSSTVQRSPRSKSLAFQAGQRIGRWTILGGTIQTPSGETKWLCRCDCGTERYVLDRALRYGGSVSCGCLRREKVRQATSPDLTGRIFGELTVIRRLEEAGADDACMDDIGSKRHRSNGSRWLCRCSCGQEYEVLGTLLVTGKRTRCSGPAHQRNYAFADITGQKIGRLTALCPTHTVDKGGSMIWHCRCDCGKEVDVSYNQMMYANRKSCGCQKKEHDQKLHGFLTHVAGTSLDMIQSKKVPTDNTTGYKGVYLIRGKYVAKIVFQKKAYYLGSYDTPEEAAQARREAEEVLFDGVAEHYRRWQEIAAADSTWAKENPVEVLVEQGADKRLQVTCLPSL